MHEYWRRHRCYVDPSEILTESGQKEFVGKDTVGVGGQLLCVTSPIGVVVGDTTRVYLAVSTKLC